MDDLATLAQLDVLAFIAPAALGIALALGSIYRALSTGGRARRLATAAAVLLGAFLMALLFLPAGPLPLALLALLGAGTWLASAIAAPAQLLWAEAVILPVSLGLVWAFL